MFIKINNQRTNFQKGFMITEVLITALLIVITMVGILPILFGGMKASKVSKTRATLSNYAQKEIEGFTQKSFSGLSGELRSRMGGASFNSFITGISPNAPLPNELLCLDVAKGILSPDFPTCSKRILVEKMYLSLPGTASVIDDVIQFSIKIRVNGEAMKPIELSAILGKDKL